MIRSHDISVVVQGAIDVRLTQRCLKSVRQHLPGAEIILSTWVDSDLTGLDFDVLVESVDPGATPMDVDRTLANNVNRQIVSSHAGLSKASRPFSIKMRTDFLLKGAGSLGFFRRYEERCDGWKVFRERVVGCTVFSINPRRFAPMPFHPSDWFFLGLTEDVQCLWEIPLVPEPETSRWYETHEKPHHPFLGKRTARYAPEQSIWLQCLRKHGEVECDYMTDMTHDAVTQSEIAIANNLVLASPDQLQIKYLKGGRGGHLDRDRFATYTHGEWIALYRKYCDPSAKGPLVDPRSLFNRGCYFYYCLFRMLMP